MIPKSRKMKEEKAKNLTRGARAHMARRTKGRRKNT
jgi:hypothetical protein